MAEVLLVLFVGVIGGASVGIQSTIVGAMGQRIGPIAGSLVVHASGLILSAAFLLFRGGEKIKNWTSLPWYMLVSGVFGLILYMCISVTLPRLGSTMMITLIIVGQLLAGVIVDHFGFFNLPVHPLNLYRLAGVVLLLAGGYLIGRY